MYPDEIDEPEEIGNEENFAEGDKVVDGGIHKVKVFRNAAALNEREENSEHHPEKEKPKVAKLRGIYVARAEPAVIDDFGFGVFKHTLVLNLP